MENCFNRTVPEYVKKYYRHYSEGTDDMTIHIKLIIIGSSLIVTIKNGKFNLVTWRGLYLCDHRNLDGKINYNNRDKK